MTPDGMAERRTFEQVLQAALYAKLAENQDEIRAAVTLEIARAALRRLLAAKAAAPGDSEMEPATAEPLKRGKA